MVSIDWFWFYPIAFLYVWWFLLVQKFKDTKNVYFFYFLFNFLIFFGPLLYYKLGFVGYASRVTDYALNIFYFINIFVALFNIAVYWISKKTNTTLLYHTLKPIQYSQLNKKQSIAVFYWFTILIAITYIGIFYESFPLVLLFSEGELGERLDQTETVPFFILFSSFFMIFIPSAFLFLRHRISQWYLRLLLFLFLLFCLTIGGGKGIVSFFLLFYVVVCIKEDEMKRFTKNIFTRTVKKITIGILLITGLGIIYALLKGKTELNSETITYLIESPLRRLLAGQGLGYIARIELNRQDAFNSSLLIKHIAYSYIYEMPIGSGSAPTHFTGSLIVQIGYFLTFLVFIFYTVIITQILNSISHLFKQKEDSFILWSFFIPVFLFTNGDIVLATAIRIFFVFANITILKFLIKFRFSKQ